VIFASLQQHARHQRGDAQNCKDVKRLP